MSLPAHAPPTVAGGFCTLIVEPGFPTTRGPLDLSQLNPSQKRAVLCVDGPVLVLAGAGSGKTRVITHRIVHLMEQGVAADHIVAVSFTNKAADEMRERVASMIGRKAAAALNMATFHSLGAQMLREDPTGFGLPSARFSILDQGDIMGMVRGLLREHGHHGGGGDRRYDIPGIVQRISLWKNAFVTPATVEREIVDEYDVVAASIYGPYEDRLRTLGAVDFDDLVCLVAHHLRDDDAQRARWRTRFSHMMVDEYQDTNDAQFEFLRQLVGPPHNLCVVGDDDQAIYGWRGAKVENILQFDREFPTVEIIKLEENYRCRAPIVACANAVVLHNQTRRAKSLINTRPGGPPVTVVVAHDSHQESAWVGKTIRKMVYDQGVNPGDIAVLYRSAQQGKPIEEELQQHGVRYQVLGGQSTYDKKEFKDALAYLKALVRPRDDLAIRRALETPPRGIGRVTMDRLHHYAQEHHISLLEAVHRASHISDLPSRSAAALQRFSELIRHAQTRAHARNDVSDALRSLMENVGLRDHVRRETGSDAATEARMGAVSGLIHGVGKFQRRALDAGKKPKWSDYLGTLEKNRDRNEDRERNHQTILTTLHSAKGLEWDYVFIIGVEEGTMPHRRVAAPRVSDAISGDIEEERRLFYVGMTRAREQLWISRSKHRIDRGRELERHPSRFLEELPQDSTTVYDISTEEELSSDAIGDMAAAFLSQIAPAVE